MLPKRLSRHGNPSSVARSTGWSRRCEETPRRTALSRQFRITGSAWVPGSQMAKLLTASMPLQALHYMDVDLQTLSDELSTWNHDLTERVKTLDGTFR